MKNIFCTLLLISYPIFISQSQEYKNIDWLSEFESEITVGSSNLLQQFEADANTSCLVNFKTTETNKKGNVEITQYKFNLNDVNVDQIKYEVSGKNVQLTIPMLKENKFVTVIEDDVQQNYDDELVLYFDKLDAARNAADALKNNIPNCEKNDTKWNNPDECITWLNNNLADFNDDGDEYSYEIALDENKSQVIIFTLITKDSKGTTETNKYKFNINDINEATAELSISGKDIEANFEIKNNNKYIEIYTNEEKENYDNDFEFPLENIELAKATLNAFKYLMQNSPEKELSWPSVADATAWISNNINSYTNTVSGIKQNIVFNQNGKGITTLTLNETNSKGEEIETVYSFYLSELNLATVKFDVSGESVELSLATSNSLNRLKVTENEEIQNYDDEIEIEITDIETAKGMVLAFKQILSDLEPGLESFSGKTSAISWIQDNIPQVNINELKIAQDISFDKSTNALTLNQTVKESDGESINQYLVYLNDINRNEVTLEVSGDKMYIEVYTNAKKDFIKVFKGDIQEDYENSIKIYVGDTRLAHNLENGLKLAVAEAGLYTPAVESLDEANDKISSLITEVKDDDEVYQQEFKIMEDDKCKINFVSRETDSKGITTEIMYDFSLVDIDENTIHYSVSGSVIEIELECNDKSKLIKPYKNSEEENFTSSFEILINDVMQAKDLVAALKFYVKDCKK